MSLEIILLSLHFKSQEITTLHPLQSHEVGCVFCSKSRGPGTNLLGWNPGSAFTNCVIDGLGTCPDLLLWARALISQRRWVLSASGSQLLSSPKNYFWPNASHSTTPWDGQQPLANWRGVQRPARLSQTVPALVVQFILQNSSWKQAASVLQPRTILAQFSPLFCPLSLLCRNLS